MDMEVENSGYPYKDVLIRDRKSVPMLDTNNTKAA